MPSSSRRSWWPGWCCTSIASDGSAKSSRACTRSSLCRAAPTPTTSRRSIPPSQKGRWKLTMPKNPKTTSHPNENPDLNAEDAEGTQRTRRRETTELSARTEERQEATHGGNSPTTRISSTSASSLSSSAPSALNSGSSAPEGVHRTPLQLGPESRSDELTPDEVAQLTGDEVQANSPAPGAPATNAQANWDKNTVAAILDDIATLLELSGGNPYEVRAYQNAGRAV